MARRAEHQKVVDQNYEAFCKLLPGLLKTHRDEFALLRDEKIVAFFSNIRDAVHHGQRNYEDGLYSVQEVTDTAVDLGWFSHVVS